MEYIWVCSKCGSINRYMGDSKRMCSCETDVEIKFDDESITLHEPIKKVDVSNWTMPKPIDINYSKFVGGVKYKKE